MEKKRIEIIDALRGLALILMVIHHFLYDLVVLCGAPWWLFTNPVFDVLHYIFAGTFILLSGVSSRFSHSNLSRGIKCFIIAMLMTLVTGLPIIDSPIRFGVLHLLGFCMIFFALTRKVWDLIPRKIAPFFYVALLVGSNLLIKYVSIGGAAHFLFPLGWTYPGFTSSDWFPIFPWLFVFLLGTWAGLYIRERRLPDWFYSFTCPVLPQVGRRSLLIYVLHQPVLYALVYAAKFLFRV